MDAVLGSPKWIWAEDGLTGERGEGKTVPAITAKRFGGDPEQPLKAFLEEHRGLFRHGAEILNGARKHRDHTNSLGVRTVAWEQLVDGIPVLDSVLVAHSGTRGELLALSSLFVADPDVAADRGTPNRKARATAPNVTAEDAVRRAAVNLEEVIDELTALPFKPSAAQRRQFLARPLPGEVNVQFVWLPLGDDTLRLCWDVELNRRDMGERFRLIIDAGNGAVWMRRKLTVEVSEVQYRVYTSDSPAPMSPGLPFPTNTQAPYVQRQLLSISNLNPVASPLGWLNDGVLETRGNNVDAHLDRDGDDRADVPRFQGTTNAQGVRVFDFPLDLTTSPTNYQAAAAVQLFYWCNFIHDRLYELGFTETAGNFQKDNFGRGGADNDAMIAQSQDGSGVNNANYTPARDGSPGKIQMYIFNSATPSRDGDLDADVVLHEYTHGLTDRMIGGGVGISQLQTYGMGEGWSDFYALALLSEYGDDLGGNYPMGGYITYQFSGLTQNYYYGIRRYPYSTNLNVNPLTFRDIDVSTALSHPGIPISPIVTSSGNAVHRQGEIWCSMLWDMRAFLLNKYAPTNAADYTNVNRRILGYVTRGLQLSPPNPSFAQARDAILLAIRGTSGFTSDTNQAWAAFARRGLGVGAVCPDSSTTIGVVESYATPEVPEFSVSPSGSAFSGVTGGPFAPATLSHTLFNNSPSNISWAAGVNVSWLALAGHGGVIAPGSTATNGVSLTGVAGSLPVGTYAGNVFYTNLSRTQVVSLVVSLQVLSVQGDPLAVSSTALFQSQGQAGGPFNPSSRVYQLANAGTAVLGWRATTTNQWLTLQPTDGIISGGDQMQMTVSINSNAAAFLNGTYQGTVVVQNTNTGAQTFLPVSLLVGTLDYFTEEFVTGPFDLNYSTLALAPDLSANFYRACREPVATLPHDPLAGLPITLGDDEYRQVVLTNGRQVSIYGVSSNAIYIGANGNVTFDPGPNTNAFFAQLGLTEFFARTRLAPLYADLNPARSGTITWQQLPDRLVVSWLDVPEFGTTNLNTAQVEMWYDGALRMTWLTAKINDPQNPVLYAGVSRGEGLPVDFVKSDLSAYGSCQSQATVLLPAFATETELGLLGTVLLSAPLTNDLVVTFTSSDTNEVYVYPEIVILAGQTIAEFPFDAMDDGVADGSQRATISAHFQDRPSASASLVIHDFQTASLTLNVVSTGPEGAILAGAGTVTASVVATKPITVNLLSDNTNRVLVQPTVVIPAGHSSATFDLQLVDNNLFDGQANVVIEASVVNWSGDFDVIRVSDNESKALVLALPAQVTEGQGTITDGGTLLLAAQPVSNLVFSLQTDQPGLLAVPALITNLPGQTSVKFNLLVGDNAVTNSASHVRVWVSAPGFLSATGAVAVLDDERPFAPTDPVPADLATHVHRDTILSWTANPNAPVGTVYDVFFGTNPDLSLSSPIASTTASQVTLPKHLLPDTTYYWQVLARLSPFPSEPSPVWQFRTVTFGLGIEPVPALQYVGDAFSLTVSARDEAGLLVTNYSGVITLTNQAPLPPASKVVITEIDVSGLDRVELQNVSGGSISLGGWKVLLYDWQNWPAPLATLTIPPGVVSQAGDVFQVRTLPTGLPPAFFPGTYPTFSVQPPTAWNNNTDNNPIAVLLVDALGAPVDFVCAVGADPALITQPVSLSTNDWRGAAIAPNLDATLSYQRTGSSDGNTLADWILGPRNIATNNPGLAAAFFSSAPVPFTSSAFTFAGGTATSSVTVLADARPVTFGIVDQAGRGAVANPVDVVSRNDLALSGVGTTDAIVGTPLTYAFSVTNNGPEDATSVTLVDHLGTNAMFDLALTSQGGCVVSNGVVTCELGTVASGSSATVTVLASSLGRGVVSNFASILRAEPDGNADNNSLILLTSATYPQVSIFDQTNSEPNTSTQSMTFSVRLSAPIGRTGVVTFATANGTATGGLDYQPTNGVLIFEPGVTNRTISVLLMPDSLSESNETFSVLLTSADGLELNKVTALGTITDNDSNPSLAVDDTTVTEGDAGGVVATFNVRLTAISGKIVTVSYSTANNTALAGLDFEDAYGVLSFPPGVTNRTVSVPIVGDVMPEPAKSFFVNLANAGNAGLARNRGVGTLLDNDVEPLADFLFAPVPGTNYSGAPIPMTITARDGTGVVAADFNGPATLLAIRESQAVTIGPGPSNTTWNLPLAASFHDARIQSIYLTNELGAPGRIMALALDVAQLPGQLLSNFTIRTRPTVDSFFTAAAWTGGAWTTNYQHDTLIAATGWVTFAFSTQFELTGTHLMVDISYNNSSYSSDGLVRSALTGGNRSIFLRTDSAHGNPLDWSGGFPQPTLIPRVPNVRLFMDRLPPLVPVTTGGFVNGVWNGTVSLTGLASNVVLRVLDSEGHLGESNPFALVSAPALRIAHTNDTVSLSFQSLPGVAYLVEASGTPESGWAPVSDALPGTGGVLHFLHTPASTPRFYRLRVLP